MMAKTMGEMDPIEAAVKYNQAYHAASQYGQFIANPEQLPAIYEKFYGGSKEVSGTFSDNWKDWTQPWVTDQNPDGKYVQAITDHKGKPASFYDIMASPFSDALSVVTTFDFFSSIREGYYKGSTSSKVSARKYVRGLREQAKQEYDSEQASIRSIKKSMERRSLGNLGVYLDVLESALPNDYAAIINAVQRGARSTGTARAGPSPLGGGTRRASRTTP